MSGFGAIGELALGELPAVSGGQIYSRTLSDALTTDDAPVRGVKAFRQIPQDAAELVDALLRGQMHGRTVADAAVLSDAITRAVQAYRASHDSTDISDSTLSFVQFFRRLLDTSGVTDAIAVTITLGGVTIVSRIFQDSINAEDAVMRAVRMYRTESQAIDIQDGTWYSYSITRGVVDLLSVAENAARSLLRTRLVTDPIEAADLAFRYALLQRLLLDDATADDSLTSQILYYAQLIGYVVQSLRTETVVASLDKSAVESGLADSEHILMEMRNL